MFPTQFDIYTDTCRQRGGVQWYIEHCGAMSFNDKNHAIKQAHHQRFCHKIPKCFSASRSANKAAILLCSEVVIVSDVYQSFSIQFRLYQLSWHSHLKNLLRIFATQKFKHVSPPYLGAQVSSTFVISDGFPVKHTISAHCTLKKIECVDYQ